MSTFFTLQQSNPLINFPQEAFVKDGDNLIISGEQFKRNIIKISGKSIYNENLVFVKNGKPNENVSGINNTLNENIVSLNISGLSPSRYEVFVYNNEGVSSNSFQLKVLGKPEISGFDNKSVLPGTYVRVSGSNLLPDPRAFFVQDQIFFNLPVISSGFYRVKDVEIVSYGSGYNTGDLFYLNAGKLYGTNTRAVLQVATTGISGSLGSIDILNSGVFTIANQFNNILFEPSGGNGNNSLINIEYESYTNTGLDFVELEIPYNIKRNQSGVFNNLKFKDYDGTTFTGFYISGFPNVYGFNPATGTVDNTTVLISGEDLSFATSVKIGTKSIDSFNLLGSTGISFIIPNFSDSNYLQVSGIYGSDKSSKILNVFYPPIIASGFSPNNFLAGTGSVINISGKYLQRTNYINLGIPNIIKSNITVNSSGTIASFKIPDSYTTTDFRVFSVDFPNSGTIVKSLSTNDLLISTVRLSTDLIDIKYLSGIQAAKYLDEIEINTPSGFSGDYGNLTNSEVYFLSTTGLANITGSFSISGIKQVNTSTGIRIKIPREIKNPQTRIKIRRNTFGDEYILPSQKSIDILPTIQSVTPSNTLYNSLGFITISGINASSVNKIYFSGYTGTTNIFGFKDLSYFPLDIVSKNILQITNGSNTTGYTVIEAKLGGDITGSGELFLFNDYYDTGIGYENQIITKNNNIRVTNISGYRPPNSDIFTSPSIVTSPLDQAFFYQIQTTSRATSFEISPTTISGVGEAELPPGINSILNSSNQIFGTPSSGGNYYIKIRALNGERPNEGMILQTNFGASGRSLAGPGIVYRGEWDPSIGYVGDSIRRDVVKYSDGANYWYAAITNINSTPGPTNPNWIAFSNEFSATATQILLAEQSNIISLLNVGRLGIQSGVIKSVNDIDSNLGSGFFLGYDNSYNPGKPKFRVGNQDNYIKFNGLGLDIVGPLSGILTTSKNIVNANNIVNSNYSVALGIDNLIATGSDNVFIFGTNNLATGARRSSIVAGKDNVITGIENFVSEDSNIVGGQGNRIIGSFSNIGGGRANSVDTLSTGLAGVGNQIFSTVLTGQNPVTIEFPSKFYTNRIAILNNIQKTGQQDFYDVKFSNINSIGYDVEFANILDTEDLDISLLSWASVINENLYSGSFQESDKVSQFKVFKTGIASGSQDLRINFDTPFVQTDDIIILNNLQSQDFYNNHITGINRSGFNIIFSKALEEDVIGHFFAGNIGAFTGLNENSGKILEVGSVKPFGKIIFGTGVNFDIPFSRATHAFQNVYKADTSELYISKIRESNNNNLKVSINNPIDSTNEYIFLDTVTYTGSIVNNNIQVYNTGIPSGSNTYNINLISGMSDPYIPIVDEIISGDNFYPYATSNHTTGQFQINFGNILLENTSLNIGIYRSGKYPFDSGYHFASSLILSGVQNAFDIPFNLVLGKRPRILYNLENITDNNFYVINLEDITKSGFSIKLSKNLTSGEAVRLNYLAVEGTGNLSYNSDYRILGYENLNVSGSISINTENSAVGDIKVFGRATSNNNLYYHIIDHTDRSRFNIKISSPISGYELYDFNYDYIVTDLIKDLSLTRSLLGESVYGRLAGFGFDDVGSSTIGGGTGNYIKGLVSVIGGGVRNTILGDYNVIPGGRSNSISDFVSEVEAPKTSFCTILAGNLNTITGSVQNAAIIGGERNNIQNTDRSVTNESIGSIILGGFLNNISGSYSSILGGSNNNILSSYSYGIGKNISIEKKGCLVLADSTDSSKRNISQDSLTIHFASGIYITGVSSGISPMVFDLNTFPTGTAGLQKGSVYIQSGNLKIVT